MTTLIPVTALIATGQRAMFRHRPSFLSAVLLVAIMAAFGVTAGSAQPVRSSKAIIFIAGGPSHGFLGHDYLAGSRLLADRLNLLPGFTSSVYYREWPRHDVLEAAAAIVIYADGGPQSIAIDHRDELVRLSKRGVGIGVIHYAVEVPKLTGGAEWLAFAGGYFETFYSVNPFWTARFESFSNHPVTRGVAPFSLDDEWYFNMRFRSGMKGVEPILSAVPPDDARSKKDGDHEGNATVRSGIGKNQNETVLWVSQNYPDDQGKSVSRGFGCTGGHSHQNWANDQFRKTVLNAIVWIAQGDVPENGVPSKRPDVDELLSNRDPGVPGEQVPPNFDRIGLAKEIERLNSAR